MRFVRLGIYMFNETEISQFKKSGVHSPVRIFSEETAASIRSKIEKLEEMHGLIFTEDTPAPGTPVQGSFRFKSHLLFKWLNDNYDARPKWNFYKFVINKDGKLENHFSSMITPSSEKLTSVLDKILK